MHMYHYDVLAFLVLFYFGQDVSAAEVEQAVAVPKCSSLPSSDRRQCGHIGISKQKCLSRGCCYQESSHGVSACFQRPDIPECFAIDPFMRIKCGTEPTMTEEKCKSLNCCYNNKVAGAPVTCFYPQGPCNAIIPWARVQCGEPGTKRAACEKMHCCYDDTLENVPFCYKKMF